MNRTLFLALSGLLAVFTAAPAQAQQKSVALMPAHYFSATEESADNLTAAVAQQFEGQGYNVLPSDQARATASELGLSRTRHYSDFQAIRFGRKMGATLVAYPRLLAVGIPYVGSPEGLTEPSAVVLMRVINVRTGRALFGRQIAHEFRAESTGTVNFVLPPPVAESTAAEVLRPYFQRFKGSRLEN
jgi:hypothetical protein